jgi:hypothetical protein
LGWYDVSERSYRGACRICCLQVAEIVGKAAERASGAGSFEEIEADSFFLGVDLNDEVEVVAELAIGTAAALVFSEVKADLAFGFLHGRRLLSGGGRRVWCCCCWQRKARFHGNEIANVLQRVKKV